MNPGKEPPFEPHRLTGVVDGSVRCLRCKWSGWPEDVPATCPPSGLEPPILTAQEAHDFAVELRDRGDAFVALCSRISGLPFDPDDPEVLSLDEWFAAALRALEARHA